MVREILNILNFTLFYHSTFVQLKKCLVLNNSKPVILSISL